VEMPKAAGWRMDRGRGLRGGVLIKPTLTRARPTWSECCSSNWRFEGEQFVEMSKAAGLEMKEVRDFAESR